MERTLKSNHLVHVRYENSIIATIRRLVLSECVRTQEFQWNDMWGKLYELESENYKTLVTISQVVAF